MNNDNDDEPPPPPGGDDGNNNDNGENVGALRQIQDLESWLRRNGIEAAREGDQEPNLNLVEERARFDQAAAYQRRIHDAIFASADSDSNGGTGGGGNGDNNNNSKQEGRERQLASWENVRLDMMAADGVVVADVPLRPIARSCDTVFALAASWDQFGGGDEVSTTTRSSDDQDRDGGSDRSNNAARRRKKNMHLSLPQFDEKSVKEFVRLVLLLDDPTTAAAASGTASKTTAAAAVIEDNLSADCVVDCCQIAHYLQNETVLDGTVEILLRSVDTANCASLCQLADHLNLHELFERSLGHMMKTVDELKDNAAWDDLTEELQERISNIQTAIQSSIHHSRGGSGTGRRLYFSSLDEYIAIFAERVQYYRERLAEAKEDHGRLLRGSHAWQDAHVKIEKQEKRVRTLELAFKEQKKLFSKNSSCIRVESC